MHRVRRRRGTRYDESLHRTAATHSGSILPAASGQDARLFTAITIPSVATCYEPKRPIASSNTYAHESFKTISKNDNRLTLSSLPSPKDSNPHSVIDHQTPIRCSRGFLHRGLSDACPVRAGQRLSRTVLGAGIEQPLTKRVVHPDLCERPFRVNPFRRA